MKLLLKFITKSYCSIVHDNYTFCLRCLLLLSSQPLQIHSLAGSHRHDRARRNSTSGTSNPMVAPHPSGAAAVGTRHRHLQHYESREVKVVLE